MSGHNLVSWKIYVANGLTLVFLMALTVIAFKATFIPPVLALPIAMGIAITKASFIVMIFMNVYWSSRLTQVFAAAGFCWFMILIFFLAIDYGWPELGHIYGDVGNIGVNPLEVSSSGAVEVQEKVAGDAAEYH